MEPENLECQTHEVDGKGEENTPLEPENLECQTDKVDGKDEESTGATVEINNKRFAIYLCTSIRSVLWI